MWNDFNFDQTNQEHPSNNKKQPKKNPNSKSHGASQSKLKTSKKIKPIIPQSSHKNEEANNITALSCFGNLTDPIWDIEDPSPDIYVLFEQFNNRFFGNKLTGIVVKWSPRMTLCAGLCCYEGRGGLCSVKLSLPLLKFRPRSDLINTLLHEMIHAYLFITRNNRDRDGHGPEFQKHMNRINLEASTKITVYHSFHDEVRLYQQHWWRCTGPCKSRTPFFGWVKRSMNRAPGPNDRWWSEHKQSCDGTFVKIREPEKKVPISLQKSGTKRQSNKPTGDIRKFFSPTISNNNESSKVSKIHKPNSPNFNADLDASLTDEETTPSDIISTNVESTIPPRSTSPVFPGRGNVLGSSLNDNRPRHSRLLNLYQPRVQQSIVPIRDSSSSINSNSKIVVSNLSVDVRMKSSSSRDSSTSNSNFSKSPIHSKAKQKLLDEIWSPPLSTSRHAASVNNDSTTDLLANLPEWKNKLPASDLLSSSTRVEVPSSDRAPSVSPPQLSGRVYCPVCNFCTSMSEINNHLNLCLS